MLTVCYINRQPGRGYHYSETNACGESAVSNNTNDPLKKYRLGTVSKKYFTGGLKPVSGHT